MTSNLPLCIPWIDRAETLYSYCVFVHRFNRMPSSAATARLMMLAVHSTRQHDLPCALSALVKFVEPIFGDPVQALRQHTVAGFYWPFMADQRRDAVAAELARPAGSVGLRLIGASTRTLSAAHPLKWCQDCLAEDLETLGRPRWRTAHQHPTTFVCLAHGIPLIEAGIGGKTWRWPGDEAPRSVMEACAETLILAKVGGTASTLDDIDFPRLRAATVNRLADLGVIHSRNTARHARLQKWFKQTPVGRFLARAPNGLSALASGEWLAKQIWRRPSAHAVRWTALWSTLEWESAEQASAQLLNACSLEGSSQDGPRASAAMAWPRPCPPPAFENAVAECLSYEAIAGRLGVTRSDVVRWFEAYPALRSQWRARWLAQRRRASPQAVEPAA